MAGAFSRRAIVVNANIPSIVKSNPKKAGYTDTCNNLSLNAKLILKAACNIVKPSATIWLCIRSVSNRIEHMTRDEHQDENLESKFGDILDIPDLQQPKHPCL